MFQNFLRNFGCAISAGQQPAIKTAVADSARSDRRRGEATFRRTRLNCFYELLTVHALFVDNCPPHVNEQLSCRSNLAREVKCWA